VGFIHVAQDRGQWRDFVNTVTNLWVPQKAGNLLTSWATISFSTSILLWLHNTVLSSHVACLT